MAMVILTAVMASCRLTALPDGREIKIIDKFFNESYIKRRVKYITNAKEVKSFVRCFGEDILKEGLSESFFIDVTYTGRKPKLWDDYKHDFGESDFLKESVVLPPVG